MKRWLVFSILCLCTLGLLTEVFAAPPSVPQKLRLRTFMLCAHDLPKVMLRWDAPATGPVFGYLIYRDGAFWKAASSSYYDMNYFLDPTTTYNYQLMAFNGEGFSPMTPAKYITTGTCPPPPSPPGNITAAAQGPDSVLVEWDAATFSGSAGICAYRINRVNVDPNYWPGPTCMGRYCGILAWTSSGCNGAQPREYLDEPGSRFKSRRQGDPIAGRCYKYAVELLNRVGEISGLDEWVTACVPVGP